jgi:hypothetical protein
MLEVEQLKREPLASELPALKADVQPLSIPQPVRRKPVRAPFRIMWREVRFRILPVAAFILAGICAMLLWRQWVLVESSVGAPTFAQEPAMIQNGPAIAGKEPSPILPLESAAARN